MAVAVAAWEWMGKQVSSLEPGSPKRFRLTHSQTGSKGTPDG